MAVPFNDTVFALASIAIEAFNNNAEINENGIKRLYLDEENDVFMYETTDGTTAALSDMLFDRTTKNALAEQVYNAIMLKRDSSPEFDRKVNRCLNSKL